MTKFPAALLLFTFVAALACASVGSSQLPTGWKAHDLTRPAPKVVTPGEHQSIRPPSDAIVLFDGKDLSQWRGSDGGPSKWKVVDGAMESVPGSGYIYTKREFGDVQLHVEWSSPAKVKGNGQGRGNSGVFLMGEFEIQVLDSFDNPTYADGSAGSLYGQYPPLVNASRGPGQWQSFDIIFRAPKVQQDEVVERARLTVLHNGVLVQDHSESFGPTAWIVHDKYTQQTRGPIGLQDHGNPVRFRNIWIRELKPRKQRKKPYPEATGLDQKLAQKVAGRYGAHRVVHRDGKLYFRFRSRAELLEMVPQQNDKFGFRISAGELSFEFGDDGTPKQLTATLDAAGTHTAKRSD